MNFSRCQKHNNKVIFSTYEIALLFIRHSKDSKQDYIYKCPVAEHFHVRSRQNRNRHRKEQLKRARKRKRELNETTQDI